LTLLDAMSSYAGLPIDLARQKVDFLVASVNKCLQALPGLSFVIVRSAWITSDKTVCRSYYLDLKAQFEYLQQSGQMRFTPPVQIIHAALQALRELEAEGQSHRYQRYVENFKLLKEGLSKMGFSFLLPSHAEAQILTAVLHPSSRFDFCDFHDQCLKAGFTIYPGKLTNRQDVFRLSVLGDLQSADIQKFLDFTKSYLAEYKSKIS